MNASHLVDVGAALQLVGRGHPHTVLGTLDVHTVQVAGCDAQLLPKGTGQDETILQLVPGHCRAHDL